MSERGATGLSAPAPAPVGLALGKHPCPECGGDLEWNATRQALRCPYCGTVAQAAPQAGEGAAPIVEHDLAAALANPASGRGWGQARREVMCQSCHAISVFVDGRVAQRCDFCGSPAIVAHESQGDAITPQSVLPFQVGEAQVRDAIRRWYGTRWFAPNRFRRAALTDTLHGIYLPYWTFDAHVAADWTAEAGHTYYVSESYMENGQHRTRQVPRVRWVPAAGSLRHFFDDELVPGSAGVHAPLLRQVEPFPTRTDLRPYAPEFVRGWTVERYQIDLRRAAELNMADMQRQTRALCAAQVPGDTQRNLQVRSRYQGRSFKHVLVPVWLVRYRYGSRDFQILANGYTGQVAGERPYSWVKIALAALLALTVLALLVVFGQGG